MEKSNFLDTSQMSNNFCRNNLFALQQKLKQTSFFTKKYKNTHGKNIWREKPGKTKICRVKKVLEVIEQFVKTVVYY